MPADFVMSETVAKACIDMLCLQGPALEKTLGEVGIIRGDRDTATWSVNPDSLEYYWSTHCVVFTGHLSRQYWPLFRSKTHESRDHFLCTCMTFVQHAECEHQYFFLHLRGLPPNLAEAGCSNNKKVRTLKQIYTQSRTMRTSKAKQNSKNNNIIKHRN